MLYIDFEAENNDKDHEFSFGDQVGFNIFWKKKCKRQTKQSLELNK